MLSENRGYKIIHIGIPREYANLVPDHHNQVSCNLSLVEGFPFNL